MKTLKFWILGTCIAAFAATGCDDDDDNSTSNPTTKKAEVYASSNTSAKISKTEFEEEDGKPESVETDNSTYTTTYQDADGIYYDESEDMLYHNDRQNNKVRAYANFSASAEGSTLSASFSSNASAVIGTVIGPLQNGREIAKSGNKIVVAQDAGGAGVVNAFYIYTKTNDSVYLSNVYLSPIDLWGIHLEGSTMYAVEDGTNNVVVFNNFFSNGTAALITADMTVSIEGIVRTHGITYDADADVMVLTDIGDAASDNDGAFTVITDFTTKMNTAGNNGTISLSNQIRVEDADNMMGNPVDCAYDSRTDRVYIAERLNAGGRIMAYKVPSSSGSEKAFYNTQFSGASAVFLSKK